MDFWEDFKNWFTDNIKPVTYIVAALIGVLLLAAGFSEYHKNRERKAVELLFTAREKVDALPAAQKTSEGPQILENVAKSYSNTRAGYEAIIAIADLYADAKDFTHAIQYYEKAVQSAPDDFAKSFALYNKASTEEFSGNCAQAIQSYSGIHKIAAGKFLVPEVLLAEGRCYETIKEFPKAMEVYQKIQNEHPNSTYYVNAAQVFLEKLKTTQAKN